MYEEIIILLIQMSYRSGTNTSSALNNHYLQSILPFQTVPQCEQFSKTKQFYKPEQFIWNNPHRTSKRMYPYYHQANENYQKNVKPVIEQLVQDDRVKNQGERIRRLSQIRDQTRNRFHSRQQMRCLMESKTGSRRKEHSNPVFNKTQIDIDSSTLNFTKGEKMYGSSTVMKQNPIPRIGSSKLSKKDKNIEKSRTQMAYNHGVQHYDLEMERIKKLCAEQISDRHTKIRYQFKARRQVNQLINSRIRNASHAGS